MAQRKTYFSDQKNLDFFTVQYGTYISKNLLIIGRAFIWIHKKLHPRLDDSQHNIKIQNKPFDKS
jgi:hypothetical protein